MAGAVSRPQTDAMGGVSHGSLGLASGQVPSLKGKVSDEEWTLRCDLAATYRLVAMMGWDDLVFTHISLRLPDEDGAQRFLINPYGLFFEEMTASALVKIDTDGNKVGEHPFSVNPAGFIIHSAVHMAREDAHCVLHLHTNAGVAVSAQEGGLRRLSQFAMAVHDDTAYHDYEGIALEADERARLVADLGSKSCMILRNHGTLTVGGTCGTAFLRMYFLERGCEAQVLAQAGGPVREETPTLSALVAKQASPGFKPGYGDALVWPGLMRRLARTNPGWDQ